jgi:N-acetylmuramoyl-L-alanine amidase
MNMKLIVASMSLVGLITLPVISESAPTSYTDIQPDVRCLAMNIYHEARSESLAGQYAVADVVLNRVESNRFPDTVCEVVHQARLWEGYPVRNKCQFSWYCDGKAEKVPEADKDVYSIARMIAFKVYYANSRWDFTDGATHYHADYVTPSWAATKTKTVTVGNHIFYRWEKSE